MTTTNVFKWLLIAALATPLIFSSQFWNPYISPKVFYFLLLMEAALPLFGYLFLKHPHARPSFKNPILISLFIYIFVTTISGLFGLDPWNSFFGNTQRMAGIVVLMHLFLFSLYTDLFLRLQPTAKRNLIQGFLWLSFINALFACFEWVNLFKPFQTAFPDRASAFSGNPNFLAASLVLPFFLSLDMTRTSKPDQKKWYWGMSLVFLGALYATQTRAAFLGILLGGLVYVFFYIARNTSKEKMTKRIFLTAISIPLMIASLFFVREYFPEKSSAYRLTHYTDTNVFSRLAFWDISLKESLKHPFLGIGYQNSYVVLQDKYEELKDFSLESWSDKPHNMYLEILLTGGVVGILAYIIFLGSILKTSFIKRENDSTFLSLGIFAGLVAYLVQDIFGFSNLNGYVGLFFLAGFLSSYKENTKAGDKKQVKISPLYLPLLIIPIISIFYLTLPTAVQFMHAQDINTIIRSNPEKAIELSQKMHETPVILFPALVTHTDLIITKHTPSSTDDYKKILLPVYANAHKTSDLTIKHHPLRTQFWNTRADLFIQNAQYINKKIPEDGVLAAQTSIELSPDRHEGYLALAKIFGLNNKIESAIENANLAIEKSPDNEEALWAAGILYNFNNQTDIGAPLGLRAIQQNVILDQAQALGWLISYYSEHDEDPENFVTIMEKATSIDPNEKSLQFLLLKAYFKNQDLDKANTLSDQLIKKDPANEKSIEEIRKLYEKR